MLLSGLSFGQSVNTDFGKNRVQYHDDFNSWWMYETKNFITYWYGKAKEIAKPTIQMAELDHDEIQNIMEHRFNDKIEIIVYLDVTDIKQSNIGLEETFINDPKDTKVEGNKMFVYFNGDHKHLREQIRKGIVQNAVLLNLPDWYKRGLVAYVGSYWNIEADDELRDLLSQRNGKYYDFEKFSEDYPKIAGHSFWYYLDQNYGKSSISNILYLTKINRNLESSFIYVLSQEFDEVVLEWRNFYEQKFSKEADVFEEYQASEIKLKNKKHVPVSLLRLSPDGSKMIYVYNDIGKYRIKLRDLANDDEKELFSFGFRNSFQEADYEYPQVEWNPNGLQVSILYEERDKLKLRKIILSDRSFEEQEIPESIDRIYSFSYVDTEDFVLSASDNGFSDLFSYRWKTRQFEKITDDYHDDLDVVVATFDGKKGVLFSSTRESNLIEDEKLDTILPLDNFDIFFLPLDSKECKRMTFSPKENERYPFPIGENRISFISDRSGIKNRYVKSFDAEDNGSSTTNLDRNIIRHHSSQNNELSLFTLYRDGAYKSYMTFVDPEKREEAFITLHRRETLPNQVTPLVLNSAIAKEEVQDGFLFQSEFDDPDVIEPIKGTQDKTAFFNFDIESEGAVTDYKDVEAFVNARAVASRLKFKMIDFSTGFDNEVLFEGLESYIGDDKELINQPMGIRFTGVLKDLFEDYKVEAGARYPTSLNGSEYYLMFEDNKRLVDRRFALYRKSKSVNETFSGYPSRHDKRITMVGLSQFKYPFDIYRSLRATGSLRFDRLFPKVADLPELQRPFLEERRITLRLEYVFDNTLGVDINILKGTRYKFYVEALNQFDLKLADGFDLDLSTGFTTLIGGDFRHYKSLGKWSVLALRGTAATSLGNKKMMYYLGGMEGGLFSTFNEDIPIPEGDDFAYKALAPHLRGFKHNIRNGSSYILGNAELRVPVVRQIFGNVKNNFLRNLMLTTFFDIGSAWHGLSPYSDKNPLNIVYVENPSVSVTANYFRDPIVMGYGLGMRSTLLGYYVKLDYAWGIETKEIQPARLHFSLGMDF